MNASTVTMAVTVVGSALTAAAALPYILDIMRGRAQPRIASWSIWTVVQAIGTASAFSAGQLPTACYTALCAAGCTLLADDCLRITRRSGRLVGMPGYAGLRLWADSTANLLDGATRLRAGRSVAHYAPHKRVIAGMTLASAPVRLARVYVLDGPSVARRGTRSDIRIERVGGADAIELLLPHLFRLRTRGMRRLASELQQLTTLAGEVPVSRLLYPRRWSALRGIDAAIAADLAIRDS